MPAVLMMIFATGIFAQDKQYTSAGDSDPEAKTILQQVRKKYDAYNSMDAAFTLDIELPEQPKETQKGKIARQGEKYHLTLGTQEIISDGKALYLIMHNNKEVNINNLPAPGEEESLLTPQSIFNFYDKGKFIYTLMDERSEGGKVVQYIEFKPTDRGSEYSKLRLAVDKRTRDIVHVKAFAKDGSRYTFTLISLTPNKAFAGDFFAFNKTKFPGYHVEDLRD